MVDMKSHLKHDTSIGVKLVLKSSVKNNVTCGDNDYE